MKSNTRSPSIKSMKEAEKRRNIITFSIIAAIVVALFAAVIISIQMNSVTKVKEVVEPSNVTENYGILYTSEDAGGKPADPKAKIVLVEDLSCPACKQFEEQFAGDLDELVKSGQADIEYRLVGFLDDGPVVNNHSKRAGAASLCVRESNDDAGWKKFHDWLYENQPIEGQEGQTNQEFIDAAKDLNLTVDETCVKSERYVPWMQEATDKFNANEVPGTPTVYVNGEQVESSMTAIEAAVAEANEGE